MTDRVCVDCGTPEIRSQDAKGKPTVNLNPLTGQCVPCMLRLGPRPRLMNSNEPEPFDAKARAARTHE